MYRSLWWCGVNKTLGPESLLLAKALYFGYFTQENKMEKRFEAGACIIAAVRTSWIHPIDRSMYMC